MPRPTSAHLFVDDHNDGCSDSQGAARDTCPPASGASGRDNSDVYWRAECAGSIAGTVIVNRFKRVLSDVGVKRVRTPTYPLQHSNTIILDPMNSGRTARARGGGLPVRGRGVRAADVRSERGFEQSGLSSSDLMICI